MRGWKRWVFVLAFRGLFPAPEARSESAPVTPTQSAPRAVVSEQGSKAPLYDYFEREERTGTGISTELVNHGWFKDRTSRADAFRETLTTDGEGRVLKSYEVEQLQLDEKGSVKVDRAANSVSYRYYKNKKWKDNKETIDEPFIVAPMIPRFIALNEKALLNGDKIRFRLAVPHMAQSYGFALKKREMKTVEGKSLPSIELFPTSVLLQAAVKSLDFVYDPDRHAVRLIVGKVFLKKRVKNAWESFVAETLFTGK